MEKQLDFWEQEGIEELELTVSQYNHYVNRLVSVRPVLVVGEVSNFKKIPGRNFIYFDIKDDQAVAKCFLGLWRIPFPPPIKNGTKIKIFGFPVLQKNGSFVIEAKDISIAGEGALLRAYQELKEKLEKEGLFSEEKKKSLPRFPQKVGLIAGKDSSAYFDVISELKERWPMIEIVFFPSRVQGAMAKNGIVKAIRYFNQKQAVDVLIIARGGGSAEDLQAFDSEEVVREIAASRIPTISAIGHEDHWTLSDFVADKRAKTPTKAAQIAVPDKREIEEELSYFLERALLLVKYRVENYFSKIEELERRCQRNLTEKIRQELKEAENKFFYFKQQLKNNLESKKIELEYLEKNIKLFNPKEILRLGYAFLEKGSRQITSFRQVQRDDKIKAMLYDGKLEMKVIDSKGHLVK